ncbi:hypothetical protein PP914_gp036 [Arthrobacter phage Qui]|jgi:hypothetical protein|uniref:Uncharacterized protein n=1 Tax=Arthrobacter phage Qui TaxID=2603260 RepID=A0A5B8WJZ2_9CAUD|nr:hypothetical protein PP914_gp036 [Arthrobacter phage Qui]QED11526.1 hypothetical protein SEA_QUI_36 [Arthrobacter phage Qui]QOC56358.1 hypothetical protein SEA_PAELLA_36 [Arthrobacter phage Paella]
MTDFIVFPNLDGDNVFAPEIRQAIADAPELKLAFAPRTGSSGYISSSDVMALLASKLNNSEKGQPSGLAQLDAEGNLLEANMPDRLAEAKLTENYVSKWKPRTFYKAGTAVVSPSGDVVTAKSSSTSEDEYNPAFWKLPVVDGGTP